MYCPVCENVKMKEVEKGSILIDICPNCKGVWLDRGELDKIIRTARQQEESADDVFADRNSSRDFNRHNDYEYDRKKYDEDRHDPDSHRDYGHRKKKKSAMDFFGDLFD
jgi:Uncharacterized protein conserved in bacteria